MAAKVGIIDTQTGTSATTKDFTSTDLDSETGTGCILFMTEATTGYAGDATTCIGWTDGTTDFCGTNTTEDAVSRSDAARRNEDFMLQSVVEGSPNVTGEMSFDSFITNGVRGDITDAFPSSYKVMGLVFGGTDTEVYSGNVAGVSQNTLTDVTAPGFQPDFVFFYCDDQAEVGYSTNDIDQGFGIALYNGSTVDQFSIQYYSDHNTADGATQGVFSDSYACGIVGGQQIEVSAFDSSGFSFTPRSAASQRVHYLAVKLGTDWDKSLFDYTTPTSTGDQAYTDPGFEPTHIFEFFNRCGTADSVDSSGGATAFGWSFADQTNEAVLSVTEEDGAATMVTASRYLADELYIYLDSGVGGCRSTLKSFDSNGYTRNYYSIHASWAASYVASLSLAPASSATTYTKTANAEGILEAQDKTKTALANAYLEFQDITETAVANAYLEFQDITETADAEGYLFFQDITETADAEGILKLLDITETADANAYLEFQDITETADAEGWLINSYTETADAEGWLKLVDVTETADAEGWLKLLDVTETADAEGWLKLLDVTETADAEGILEFQDITETADAEGWLKLLDVTETANANAYLEIQDITETANANAYLETQNKTKTADAEGWLAAGATTNAKIAIIESSTGTGTGTKDFTSVQLGSQTGLGGIFFSSLATTSSASVDDAQISIGWTDGTTHFSSVNTAEDDQTDTDTSRLTEAHILTTVVPGSPNVDGRMEYDSLITNGVRGDITNGFPVDQVIKAILFAGTDASVKAGSIAAVQVDTLQDVTSVGFKPDFVFFATLDLNDVAASTHDCDIGFGIAWDNGTSIDQYSIQYFSDNAIAAGGTTSGVFSDSYCCGIVGGTQITASAFDSSGFSITPSSSASKRVYYFAVALDGWDSSLFGITTPTTTGTQSYTTPDFEPDIIFEGFTRNTSADTAQTSGEATGFGFGLSTQTEEHTISITDEDGADNSNTKSIEYDSGLRIYEDDGSTLAVASTIDSFDTDGYTRDYTTVPSTGTKMFSLCLATQSAEATYSVSANAEGWLKESDITVTANAEGILELSYTATADAEGILEASYTATADGEGWLKRLDVTATADAEGILEASYTATADGEGWLKLIDVIATADGEGILEIQDLTATADGEGILELSYTATADGEGILELSYTATADAEGILEASYTATANGQGWLKILNALVTANAEGWLAGAEIVTTDAEGWLKLVDVTETATVNAYLEALDNTVTANAEGILELGSTEYTATADAEGILELSYTATADGEGWLKRLDVTATADAEGILEASYTATADGEGILEASYTATADSEGWLKLLDVTVTADGEGWLESASTEYTVTADAEAYVKVSNRTIDAAADSILFDPALIVYTATGRHALNTSTGTQSLVTLNFGNATPKAAIQLTTYATTNDTEASHGQMSIGFTDGTSDRCICLSSEDAQGTTDTVRGLTSNFLRINIPGNFPPDVEADFDSWVNDGVQIDITIAPSAAYLTQTILFGGDNLETHVGSVTTGSVNSAQNITTVGFEADLVFFLDVDRNLDTEVSDNLGSFGVAHNGDTVTQRCIGFEDDEGDAVTNIRGIYSDSYTSSVPGDYQIEISDFDAQGFSITPRTAGARDIAWLALKLPDKNLALTTLQTSPLTGDQEVDLDVNPDLIIAGLSMHASVNTLNDTGDAFPIGMWAADGTDEFSTTMRSEDGADPTDTACLSSDKIILTDDAGDTAFVGSLKSFDGDGFTVTWTSVDATPRHWWLVSIGDDVSTSKTLGATANAELVYLDFTVTANADGLLEALDNTTTATANGWMFEQHTKTATASGQLVNATALTAAANAYLLDTPTVTTAANGWLFEEDGTLRAFADGYLVNTTEVGISANGSLFKGVAIQANAILEQTHTMTCSADGFILGVKGQWDTVDYPDEQDWTLIR